MATYKVKKGDTLSGIAKKYGVNYMDVAKENGISNPNNIYEGQTLNIGGASTSQTTNSNASSGTKDNKTPTQTTASANTKDIKPWSYAEFQASQSTLAADKNRQDIASQKPGDFTYGAYDKSDPVKLAEAMLQQHMANKPGEYNSAWQAQLDDTMNQILNREKFSYDLNGDALYQQYKDQYTTQGKMAMMDTMGQAQAMTGGYGNSYAQSVGQQAYQGYLQQLNDKIPELYQLALDQYSREGQDLYNQYALYADREGQDYGRYRDSVSDYYSEYDRLTDNARYEAEQDYGKYIDGYNMSYGQYRDQVSDWQSSLNRADSEYWNQYDRDYGKYSDDRNMSYEQYWQDQAFQYQQDRDKVADEKDQQSVGMQQQNTKYDRLVNLITNTGYTPSAQELADAGMSESEAAAYQKFYEDQDSTKSTTGTGGRTYKQESKKEETKNKPKNTTDYKTVKSHIYGDNRGNKKGMKADIMKHLDSGAIDYETAVQLIIDLGLEGVE